MHSMSSRRARRRFLGSLAAAAAAQALPRVGAAENRTPITRAIPATGELLPVIGLGTWITFNVAPDATNEAPLIPVMQELFARGGTMIDSSPMYGYSEAVIGDLLKETPRHRGALFSATKIWAPAKAVGAGNSINRGACGACSASTSCTSTTWCSGKRISKR